MITIQQPQTNSVFTHSIKTHSTEQLLNLIDELDRVLASITVQPGIYASDAGENDRALYLRRREKFWDEVWRRLGKEAVLLPQYTVKLRYDLEYFLSQHRYHRHLFWESNKQDRVWHEQALACWHIAKDIKAQIKEHTPATLITTT